MTGMGKSNLVSLITKKISEVKGTVIIFDYHNDYTTLNIPNVNVIDAKINPRLLEADQFSEVLEIRENADVQQRVLRMSFTQEVKEAGEFWNKLEYEVDLLVNSEPVFIILEEAHVFIPKDHDTAAKYWAAKIAREGRKFGVGLGIVSQRPRSVDLNILSQMGSFAIMKIIQEDDQRQIASATESTSRELISQLTSLNVGDAVLVGQWTNLPSMVHVEEVKEKKMGADQSATKAWIKADKMKNVGVESTQGLVQKDLLLD